MIDINSLDDQQVGALEEQIQYTIETMRLIAEQPNITKGQAMLLKRQAGFL